MKKILPLLLFLIFVPLVTFAEGASIQNFLKNIPGFISNSLIPFLFAIAFVAFVYNTIRYFVIGGSNEKEHENARSFALYSLYAFLFLISLWGIVNLLTDTLFGTPNTPAICPDYLKDKPGGCTEAPAPRPNYIDTPTHQQQNGIMPIGDNELPA